MATQDEITKEEKIEASEKISDAFTSLKTTENGLTSTEAASRLKEYGHNEAVNQHDFKFFRELILRFYNPLTITLIVVAIISFFLGQHIDAAIVILMAVLSVVLSFIQEFNASQTAKKLNEMVKVKAKVMRDGKIIEVPIKNIVPGDILELTAGKMVPADVRIINSNNLYVNQSALNGESFPVLKDENSGIKGTSSIFDTEDLAFMGSSVAGGSATALVLFTGKNTEFGKLSHEITTNKNESSFDRGIKGFTLLMIKIILILVSVIFVANLALKGNPIESLLFALAIAIGLTPEMLPMIVTINLSKGAMDMAKKKVIIKELSAIQNFGAMDILCTDKTGTLTIDEVALIDYEDPFGDKDEKVFELAYLNSSFQSGLENLLDTAVIKHKKIPTTAFTKISEIPFDFNRRVMSVVLNDGKHTKIIAKGAPEAILANSSYYQKDQKIHKIDKKNRDKFIELYNALSADGFRVLALAYKEIAQKKNYDASDEEGLIFAGFISFLDPPKPTAEHAIMKLGELGIKLKVLSGDNELVTRKICSELNIQVDGILTGEQIDKLDNEELRIMANKANIFTRLTPLQKEKIVRALQEDGHCVGFMGDGINDSPTLKIADVGISVNNATDIAKETAEIILLEKDLTILADCVKEGRKTFGNTIKYIKMGASSNFGNMFSMMGASFFLPFLPMLPSQILLNNFLYDVSQVALPTDRVDDEYLALPKPWNINFIRQFIIFIGPISSIFDFVTFWVMLAIFHAPPALFHTGWFVESLTTQVFVVYIIRTNKIPFIESRPSKGLFLTTLGVVALGAILPYSPLGQYFGFSPLPIQFFLILTIISVVYLLLVQVIKNYFLRRYSE